MYRKYAKNIVSMTTKKKKNTKRSCIQPTKAKPTNLRNLVEQNKQTNEFVVLS